MSLQTTIEAIQDLLDDVTGVLAAPDYPVDVPAPTPIVITYGNTGRIQFNTTGDRKGLHNIYIDLLITSSALEADVRVLMPFVDSIPAKLFANPTLSGTVDVFGDIAYQFLPQEVSGISYRGIRFIIENVKIRSTN